MSDREVTVAHEHEWDARPDAGMAMYSCECGEWGHRSVKTGRISKSKGPWPLRTVDYKSMNRPPKSGRSADYFTGPILMGFHSNRTDPLILYQLRPGLCAPSKHYKQLPNPPIVVLAWREYLDCMSYCSMPLDSVEVDPPRWFVRDELGFSFDSGPSIEWTCQTLAKHNRAAMVQLGHEAPKKYKYPLSRESPRPPRKQKSQGVDEGRGRLLAARRA